MKKLLYFNMMRNDTQTNSAWQLLFVLLCVLCASTVKMHLIDAGDAAVTDRGDRVKGIPINCGEISRERGS